MADITSANAVIMITVPLVFPTPVRLQGFSTDDIYDSEEIEIAELQMGVDGVLSAGFIWVPAPQKFTLQADSPSNAFFDAWRAAEIAAESKFPCSGTTALQSIQTGFDCVQGFLSKFTPFPSAGKTLKPRTFTITWQNVTPAVLS